MAPDKRGSYALPALTQQPHCLRNPHVLKELARIVDIEAPSAEAPGFGTLLEHGARSEIAAYWATLIRASDIRIGDGYLRFIARLVLASVAGRASGSS
jgi:hypothetical protein